MSVIPVTLCKDNPRGVADRIKEWSRLLPGYVRTVTRSQIQPRWPRRAGVSLILGRIALPRREALGLEAVDQLRAVSNETPDLSDDHAARTTQAPRTSRILSRRPSSRPKCAPQMRPQAGERRLGNAVVPSASHMEAWISRVIQTKQAVASDLCSRS